MITKIKLYKQSLYTDDHMVVVETPVYNPKTQRILVSVNNKVVEGVYNPKTKNTTAKLVAPSPNASHPLAAQLPQNADMRVKVFVYDFMEDKILTAKLQEFEYKLQYLDYFPTDELLSTSPVIIGEWDKKGLVERAMKEDRVFNVNGYFYNIDGSFEGKIALRENIGNMDDVYSCTAKSKTKDKEGKEIEVYVGIVKLNINHFDFQKICNIVKHEGLSNEPEEYLYIALANYNEGKNKKTSMFKRLLTSYSSVDTEDKNTPLLDEKTDNLSKYCRKGVIDALSRDVQTTKIDPTDGARFWDGVDFLAWGIDTELKADSNIKTGHNKFDEYSYVKIKKELFDKFVINITQKYPNGVQYKSNHKGKTDSGTHTHKKTKKGDRAIYSIPAMDFLKEGYWTTGDFYYENKNKKTSGIEATQVAGYSIFWKEIKG